MVDFDGDHLSEFWIANGLRGNKTYFTADGEWNNDDNDMWAIPLSKVFPLEKNKKLYYQYDFGSCWRFQITKKGKETTPLSDLEYPCLLEEKGIKPLEYGADDVH